MSIKAKFPKLYRIHDQNPYPGCETSVLPMFRVGKVKTSRPMSSITKQNLNNLAFIPSRKYKVYKSKVS